MSTPQTSPSDQATQMALDVGQVVSSHRNKLNLSQEKLAELANCHRNNIGLIERGESCPSIYTVETIAEALGLTASDLLREAGH